MSDSAAFGILLGSLLLVLIVAIGWYVLQAVAYWKIFTKAGEPGWKSLIPLYNTYTQYKLTWAPVWFFVFAGCVCLNIFFGSIEGAASYVGSIATLVSGVISIISNHKLSTAFGHGIGFTIGLILLNPIFMLILGFGDSQYQGPQ